MNSYKDAPFGSFWAKWDLHVHTPDTLLSDSYVTTDGEDVWTRFCRKIEQSDVLVFGITDYFSVENYKRFLSTFRNKYPETKKVFLPNIEFRLEASVNKKAEEVNLHVIFSNEVEVELIEDFLGHLKTNILRQGTYVFCSKLDKKDIESAAIDHKNLRETLKTVFGDKCYIVGAAANNQGLRADTDSPRKINLSDDIERVCDFVFGGPQNTAYYLRTDRLGREAVAEAKPVVSGCDAHSFVELDDFLGRHVESKGKYTTWIKAAPTFSGLKQILYEPSDRVVIQLAEPDYKDPHNVIKKISLKEDGDTFGTQEILFSPNLNTIIGGKSSGKSLLLYALAESIDQDQLKRISEKFGISKYNLTQISIETEWRNGEVNVRGDGQISDFEPTTTKHRITYIPQLYINHLAEKDNKTELNKLIDDILNQDHEFKQLQKTYRDKIASINEEVETTFGVLIRLRSEGLEAMEQRKAYGTLESYVKEVETLQNSLNTLRANTSVTESEMGLYNKLVEEKNLLQKKELSILSKLAALDGIRAEIAAHKRTMLGSEHADTRFSGTLDKFANKLLDDFGDHRGIFTRLSAAFDKLLLDYDSSVSGSKLAEDKVTVKAGLAALDQKIHPYAEKLKNQSNLGELAANIEKSKTSRLMAEALDRKGREISDEYKVTKRRIVELLSHRNLAYSELAEYVNKSKGNIGSGIQLSCSVTYPSENFHLLSQVDKRNANNNSFFQSLFLSDESVNFSKVPSFFEQLIKIENSTLRFNDESKNLLLRQNLDIADVFHGLLEDHLALSFNVTYRGDDLTMMSPGKKGTVLLILFLQISSAAYPILIDQPEDNLDNRTIYDLLCKIVKEKKRERQIIVVTHNANLVVATDSENIVVANQEGQDPKKDRSRYKFEYVNGPIELSFLDEKRKGILFQNGIKQHVCDILEGGDEAFRRRERKYR